MDKANSSQESVEDSSHNVELHAGINHLVLQQIIGNYDELFACVQA